MLKTSIAALLALVAATSAAAQKINPDDAALIPMAERVLQRIDVMTADFTFNNAGGAHTGRLFVDRAGGRMRMEFDPPMGHLLIANGPRVDFIGGDGTVLNAGTQSTPLALIFGREPKLSGEVQVLEIKAGKKDAYFAVGQRDRPGDGKVILHYDRTAPGWALKGWGLLDGDGRYTRTALTNVRHGGELADALFVSPVKPRR